VGTQSASISIFNVAALTVPGVDPLLTTFSASRPSVEYGAVRDMAFAPGYSDLLAWTEDRDRVGIADLRHGYISRQIISLGKMEDYEHVEISDKGTIDPRLLQPRGGDTLTSTFASALDISPDSRDALARYYSPLTSEETLVLEALQEHRRRQEQREQREQRVRAQGGASTDAPRSLWAERSTRSARASDSTTSTNTSTRPRGERSASASRTVDDIMSDIRNQRERMRGQLERREQQERLRGPMREESTAPADRRRPPVPPSTWRVPMPSSLEIHASLNPSERRSLRVAMGSYSGDLSTVLATMGALRNASDAELANYSQASSSAREGRDGNAAGAGESSSSPSSYDGYRPSVEGDLRRRERAAYLMREWEENPSRRLERFFTRGGEPAPPHPHDTSGLAWSADGQTL